MTARFADHILAPGLLATRPAANAVPVGTLYPTTDEGIIYRSDGAAWAVWRPAADGLPVGGTTGQVLTKQSATDGDAAWADASGGGGGSPLTPATPDDHFAGSSLDAAWSLAGSYVAGDYTVHDSYLDVANARVAGSYIYRAAPAGDFVATMRASILGLGGAAMFGIMATDNAGNGTCAGFYNSSPDGPGAIPIGAGAYTSGFVTSNGPRGSAVAGGIPCWYRMRRVGTTVSCALSLNGEVWSAEASRTDATTYTRLGFGNVYGGAPAFQIDFFDVV